MKIALTTEYFHPFTGGAEQSALELAKALKNKGHDMIVFTRGDGEEDEVEGIQVKRIFCDLLKGTIKRDVPFPRLVDKREEERFFREIRGEAFDILHSNNRDTAVFTVKVGKELKIPAVAHIRDYWPICPKRDFLRPDEICEGPRLCGNCMARYYNAWHKIAFYYKMWSDTGYRYQEIKKNADYFIYNSSYTQDRIGLEPKVVVYNPVDVDKIKGGKKEPGKILYIGNVTKRKGVEMLSEAALGLNVTLHILGDGYLLSKIQGKNIVKHGRVEYPEVLEHLSNSEMLVVPSLWPEPFGRVAVEGMAAGLPVIVTPIGGLPEIVGDAGIVLKGMGEKELREEIQTLHENEQLRKQMGDKGKLQSRMFHPKKIAEETISVYEEVLDIV
ncbi:MAG: glycosyltransferase family 4 protein [Thermoplasmata archaeon]|nr:MAG: glycosyltransferase family 4 protein [Thermoplasmata archaeon]